MFILGIVQFFVKALSLSNSSGKPWKSDASKAVANKKQSEAVGFPT